MKIGGRDLLKRSACTERESEDFCERRSRTNWMVWSVSLINFERASLTKVMSESFRDVLTKERGVLSQRVSIQQAIVD